MADKPKSMIEIMRMVQQDMPMILESIKVQAEMIRYKFLELKKQGFTDAEALELCKGKLLQ